MTRRASATIYGVAALVVLYGVFVQPYAALWLWWIWIGGAR